MFPLVFEPWSVASILDHCIHIIKRAKVYLYESHVWQVMITYGGIILSFIKEVGAEQRPEECQRVCVCVCAFCVCMHACMHQCWPVCERV